MNTNMQNSLAQLKDIKPIVEVHSNSLSILIALTLLVVGVVAFGVYKYLTRVRKTPQPTQKELAFERLKNLNFDKTKELVYGFSLDGSLFCDETNRAEFEQIEKELQEYKYKKEVAKLPDELQERIKSFIAKLKLKHGDKK